MGESMFVDDLFKTSRIHVQKGLLFEPVDQCYFVISGKVTGKYGTKRVSNFTASDGEFFGICGVLIPDQQLTSAIAVDDSELTAFSYEDISGLLNGVDKNMSALLRSIILQGIP